MSVTTHSQASGLQGDLSPEPVGLLYSALVKNKLKEIKTLRRKNCVLILVVNYLVSNCQISKVLC